MSPTLLQRFSPFHPPHSTVPPSFTSLIFFSFLALICYFHPHTPLFLLCSPFNLSGETPTEREREDAGTMGETMGGEKKQHFNR